MISSPKLRLEATAYRVRPKDEVVFRRLGGEHVLLDLDTGNFYSLNETASQIWDLLTQGLSSDSIVSYFIDNYGVAPERATADVWDLLIELARRGLVRVDRKA